MSIQELQHALQQTEAKVLHAFHMHGCNHRTQQIFMLSLMYGRTMYCKQPGNLLFCRCK